MLKINQIAAASITAGLMVVAATPAAAVVETFATYSASTNARNFRLVNSGNGVNRANDAVVYSTKTGSATTPGGAAVKFSFLIPVLAPFVTDINAIYTLNGTIAKGSPVASTGLFSQTGFSGAFSFVTTSDITVSGPGFITHTYAAGSNLLSGTFTGGMILGTIGGTSGSTFATGLSGGSITYSSDFLDFSGSISLDRAQSLTAVNAAFSKHAGANGALSSFRGVAGGQFSSDPVPVVNFLAVPEPATWSMMIAGFGLIGVARRRRNVVTA